MVREILEKIELDTLAPYAVKSIRSRGRRYPEPKHPYRTEFQRDRDRIAHSTAFRRLQYKTQVFVNHEGDHYRTRLTHTLEVAFISRSVARALRLNEDLTEAIALVHDLGHTPFGHAGEEALNEILKDRGGFEHNLQCLRVVDIIESRYPDFPGLNLTYELREGILKHHRFQDIPGVPDDLKSGRGPSLESRVVDIADEIAYNCHDVDDGLSSGILLEKQLEDLAIWQKGTDRLKRDYTGIDRRLRRHYMVRFLIDYLVTSLVNNSAGLLGRLSAKDFAGIRNGDVDPLCFADSISDENRQLKEFLDRYLYKHEKLARMSEEARKTVRRLYDFFRADPRRMPSHVFARTKNDSPEAVVIDYIAGMTDRFAASEYERSF